MLSINSDVAFIYAKISSPIANFKRFAEFVEMILSKIKFLIFNLMQAKISSFLISEISAFISFVREQFCSFSRDIITSLLLKFKTASLSF